MLLNWVARKTVSEVNNACYGATLKQTKGQKPNVANYHQGVHDYMEEDGEDDADSMVDIDGEANDDTRDVNLDKYDVVGWGTCVVT